LHKIFLLSIKTVLPLNTGIASYSQYVLNQNDNRRYFLLHQHQKNQVHQYIGVWVFLLSNKFFLAALPKQGLSLTQN
jgi:hypothetical protein